MFVHFKDRSLLVRWSWAKLCLWKLRRAHLLCTLLISDTWSTCTHMNVKRGHWATPTSFKQPSTAIDGRAGDRALAALSSPTLQTGLPPCCPRRSSPRPAWAWQWAPTGPRWVTSTRSRKVRFVYCAACTSEKIYYLRDMFFDVLNQVKIHVYGSNFVYSQVKTTNSRQVYSLSV